MYLPAAAITDVGRIRQRNEDHAVVASRLVAGDHDEHAVELDVPTIAGVLDGMGGHPAGDVASRLAAEVLASSEPPRDAAGARDVVMEMQRRVYEHMEEVPEYRRMGTTVVFASLVDTDRAIVAGVGDSSAWWVDHEGLRTVVEEDRSVAGWITQCIGGMAAMDEVVPHVAEVQGPGRLLLCTDGLADVVDPHHAEGVLHDADTPKDAARTLVDLALDRGAPDNVTVVVLDLAAPTT